MAKINDSTVLFNRAPSGFLSGKWLDASVTGNGKIGAAVLGAYSNESILINHASLKHRGYTGVLQDVSDVFPKVRKFYNEAKIFDAERVLSAELEKRGYRPMPDEPLPLAIINLNFINEGYIRDYQRTTDMKSGEVCVSFKVGGTSVTRSLCVARGSDVIAYNVTKSGADKFNVFLGYELPEAVVPNNAVVQYDGGMMFFSARGANGLDYGIVSRIVMSSGNAEHATNGISIRGCDGFTIFSKCFVGSSRDVEFKNLKSELGAIRANYDKLQSSAENGHKRAFSEVQLELGSGSGACELSSLVACGLDAGLIERLFNFGKYLSVCGGGVMSAAGLWGGDAKIGNGHLDINLAVSLLYDGITRCVSIENLLELFEYYEKYVDDLKKNAARLFGARGYFVPSVVSPQSALLGSTSASVIHFISAGAILANLFYSYFLTTGDVKILKGRILPFMREVCNFYSDFVKLDNTGCYSTIPSYSPSSTPGNVIQGKPLSNFAFATNSTIDFLALEALLDNLIEAAEICGGALTEVAMWRDMKTKIPQYQVNDTAGIKEYTNSAFIDGVYNCGCLHSYGLWPLKNFSFSDAEVSYRASVSGAQPSMISLRKASANAIVARLSRASGFQSASSLAMYAIQLAHAGEGVTVKNALMMLVDSCVTPSGLMALCDWRGSGWTRPIGGFVAESGFAKSLGLVSSESLAKSASSVGRTAKGAAGASVECGGVALDICANIGFATAIMECIVQSNSRALKILPAVFQEIGAGRISGVSTDFGAKVAVDWDMRRGKCSVKILPKVNCTIDVIMPREFKRIRNKDIVYHSDICTVKGLQLFAGKSIVLDF